MTLCLASSNRERERERDEGAIRTVSYRKTRALLGRFSQLASTDP